MSLIYLGQPFIKHPPQLILFRDKGIIHKLLIYNMLWGCRDFREITGQYMYSFLAKAIKFYIFRYQIKNIGLIRDTSSSEIRRLHISH